MAQRKYRSDVQIPAEDVDDNTVEHFNIAATKKRDAETMASVATLKKI